MPLNEIIKFDEQISGHEYSPACIVCGSKYETGAAAAVRTVF